MLVITPEKNANSAHGNAREIHARVRTQNQDTSKRPDSESGKVLVLSPGLKFLILSPGLKFLILSPHAGRFWVRTVRTQNQELLVLDSRSAQIVNFPDSESSWAQNQENLCAHELSWFWVLGIFESGFWSTVRALFAHELSWSWVQELSESRF